MPNPNQISVFEELQLAHPTLEDELLVRKACERILQAAGVAPPVPVKVLASVRNIVKVAELDLPYAGMLTPTADGRLEVHIRRDDPRTRKRFTVCHETGHTLFPGFVETKSFRCAGPKTWTERMCDIAAAELLMPWSHFTADFVEAGDLTLDAIEALSAVYEASIEATTRRAIDTSGDASMMLVLSRRHKPAEAGQEASVPAKLRVDYHYDPKKAFGFVRQHKSVTDSALKDVLEARDVADTGTIDELVSGASPGEVTIQARPYGRRDRVIALITR